LTVSTPTAANTASSGRATTTPKAGDGPVEMARMFKLAKASAIKSRAQAINQLKSILVSADPELRESLAGLSYKILVRRCAALAAAAPTTATTAAVYTLRLLAQRIQHLNAEIRELEAQITAVIASHAPSCLSVSASGPTAPPRCSSPSATTPSGWPARHPSPPCAVPVRSRHPPARPNAAASTVAATGRPTPPSTASCLPGCVGTRIPAPTSTDA
jgi:hypothetical protein